MVHEDELNDEEPLVHAMLRLACDHPGRLGRLRSARVIGGYDLGRGDAEFDDYAVATSWTLTPIIDLIDGLIEACMLVQTPGARPTLAATRSGFRSLEALEGIVEYEQV